MAEATPAPVAPAAGAPPPPPAAPAAAQPSGATAPDKGTSAPAAPPPAADKAPAAAAPGGAEPAKKDGAAPGGAAPAAPVAPTEDAPTLGGQPRETAPVEVKVPEGLTVDEAVLAEFKTLASELKLDGAGAQRLMDLSARSAKAAAAKAEESARQENTKMVAAWKQAAETDKEFGGKDYQANLKLANKALDKLATPELKQLLKDFPGLAYHPGVIGTFWRVGKGMAPDTVAGTVAENGGVNSAPKEDEGDGWDKLYRNARKGLPPDAGRTT